MSIESFKQQIDNEYEGSFFDDPPSKQEKEESRKSFIEGLKKAVKKGGKVIVEARGGVSYYCFKETNGPSWCISKNDAIDYCGYNDRCRC